MIPTKTSRSIKIMKRNAIRAIQKFLSSSFGAGRARVGFVRREYNYLIFKPGDVFVHACVYTRIDAENGSREFAFLISRYGFDRTTTCHHKGRFENVRRNNFVSFVRCFSPDFASFFDV